MKKIIFASIIAIAGYAQIQTSEIRFKPADQFISDGARGLYNKDLQTATITNPATGSLYEFTDVKTGGINRPAGLIEIGSYTYSPAAVNGVKRMGVRLIQLYGRLVNREEVVVNNQDVMPGNNATSYAPIIFTPLQDPNMIGNYFANSQIATINSANASNDQANRLFTNVIATNDREIPAGLQPIGYYSEQPKESATSFAQMMTYLYGQEQN